MFKLLTHLKKASSCISVLRYLQSLEHLPHYRFRIEDVSIPVSKIFAEGFHAREPSIEGCPYANIAQPEPCDLISTTRDWRRFLEKASHCQEGAKVNIFYIDSGKYLKLFPNDMEDIDYHSYSPITFYEHEQETTFRRHIPPQAISGYAQLKLINSKWQFISWQSNILQQNTVSSKTSITPKAQRSGFNYK